MCQMKYLNAFDILIKFFYAMLTKRNSILFVILTEDIHSKSNYNESAKKLSMSVTIPFSTNFNPVCV
jgi:hypothetical protein